MAGVDLGIVYKGRTISRDEYYRIKAQEDAQAAQSSAGTNVNTGSSITNTGGNMPSSVSGLTAATGGVKPSAGAANPQVYVPQGAGKPLVTQQGYEAQQMQSQAASAQAAAQKSSQDAEQAHQRAQLEANQKMQQAQEAARRGDMELASRLQAEAEARRMGQLSTVMSTVNGQPTVQGSQGPAFDETGARAAAFARAKEQAGSTALASLKGLQDVMAGSGLTGSSVEGQGVASIVNGARGDVNDFTREEMIQDLDRAGDVADRNYAGAITQRGQNMSMLPSLMALLTANGGGAY